MKAAAGSAQAEAIQGSPETRSPTPAPTSSATVEIEGSMDSRNPAPSSTNMIRRCLPLKRGGGMVAPMARAGESKMVPLIATE